MNYPNLPTVAACQRSVLDCLRTYTEEITDVSKPSPGTCVWLYQRCDVLRYLHSPGPALVRITGPPGCGKSVLARGIVERYEASELVLWFRFGTSRCSASSAAFVASILSQLIVHSRTDRDSNYWSELRRVQQAADSRQRYSYSCDFDVLWGCLRKLLSLQASYILLVDGIDEFRESADDRSLKQLANDISLLRSTTRGRVILLCRSGCRINSLLPADMEIRMDENTIRDDINRFMRHEFNRLEIPSHCYAAAQSWIGQNAQGSFLVPKLYLRNLHNSCTTSNLNISLSRFPPGVFKAFDSMIQHVSDGLDDHKQETRRSLLMSILAAPKSLSVLVLASLEGLVQGKEESLILDLCSPLVEVCEGRVIFVHSLARELLLSPTPPDCQRGPHLRISLPEAHSHHAHRLLTTLHDKRYSSPAAIARLIRTNIQESTGHKAEHDEELPSDDDPAYHCAATSWFTVLAEIDHPSDSLLELLGLFLKDPQFVYWSEYTAMMTSEFGIVIQAHTSLRMWLEKLPSNKSSCIDLEQFCVRPYRELSSVFSSESKDRELSWLTLQRLGGYMFNIGNTTMTFDIRREVRDGLMRLLGPEHPLSLQARLDAAFACFLVNEMKLALKEYTQIYESHLRVFGAHDVATLKSLAFIGQTNYFLTNFAAADKQLSEAIAGTRKALGDGNIDTLSQQWVLALVLKADRQQDRALAIFSHIHEERTKSYGEDDLFAVMVEGSRGDIYRKQGQQDLALQDLRHAYKIRLRVLPKTHYAVIDIALGLSITLWEFGMNSEARALLNDVEIDDAVPSLKQRACQLAHMRALLAIDGGETKEAIRILRSLFHETVRSEYSRALYWALLDLAPLLRAAGNDDEAGSLFHNIVTSPDDPGDQAEQPKSGGDEPDPPRYLEIAERALRLVRRGKRSEADQLLAERGLAWVREQDFWIIVGAPISNTADVRSPMGEDLDGFSMVNI